MPALRDPCRGLIGCASNYSNRQWSKAKHLLKDFDVNKTTSLSPAQIFYIIGYTHHKYLYIDPLFQKLLGFDKEPVGDMGSTYFTQLWNRNDFKVFNEKVLPETIDFLRRHPISDYPDFSFSFNYRVKTKDGASHTFLQQAIYFSDPNGGNRIAAVGTIVNITNYKTDSSIIHTVERIRSNCSALPKVPLFKSVYYPDKTDSILTKREFEILAGIYEGMSSKQIADKFFVSINTVNNHRKNMLQKTNTNNSSELLQYARRKGLL